MTVHNVRRVVTGVTADGKSVFVEDGPPPRAVTFAENPGNEFFMLWGTDDTPSVPTGGEDPTPTMESFMPGRLGSRFLINRWPPHTEVRDRKARIDEMHKRMPGIAESTEAEDFDMHTTDSIDYGVVLSGEMWLELDDGEEVHLTTGDCIIQNGTRHAWRNRSSEPCVMAFVMVGANR
jgi:mannose-6-phosphate isomerase-like protein (cupin superfamily)